MIGKIGDAALSGSDVLGYQYGGGTGISSATSDAVSLGWSYASLESGVPIGVILPSETYFDGVIHTMIRRAWPTFVLWFAAVAVLVFMVLSYGLFGLLANIALVFNVAMIFGLLSAVGATLTLPGVAGIVLTIGMAVDANVLIFERIREELSAGAQPQSAISAGYDKALSSIADAHSTTLIAAIVLFAFGTGPIKGFAITLSLGIVTSMFTAIVGTRAIVNLAFGGRKLESVPV